MFSVTLYQVNSMARISFTSVTLNNQPMDAIDEIYRQRLRMLVTTHGNGRQSNFAALLDRSPAQVAQWLHGSRDSKSGAPRAMSRKTARFIEQRLGLPEGWMDQPLGAVDRQTAGLAPVQAPSTEYLPGFEQLSIPVLANAGSMGPGVDQMHDEVVVGRLTVSPQWATRTIKPTALENLRFIHGYGDSMEPTFIDGDILLVDIGVVEPKIDGVYVLEANDRIYIKRVRQRLNGEFEISSDNPTVKTIDVLDGSQQVAIRGRVVWAWNGRKM